MTILYYFYLYPLATCCVLFFLAVVFDIGGFQIDLIGNHKHKGRWFNFRGLTIACLLPIINIFTAVILIVWFFCSIMERLTK